MRTWQVVAIAFALAIGSWVQPYAQDFLNSPPRASFPSDQWDVTYTCLQGLEGFDQGWEWHAGAWQGSAAFAVKENSTTGKTDFCVIHLVSRR